MHIFIRNSSFCIHSFMVLVRSEVFVKNLFYRYEFHPQWKMFSRFFSEPNVL